MNSINAVDLYEQRMLVFMEEEPQSNKYRQVLLNAEEFKRFSMSIGTVTSEKYGDIEMVEMKLSDKIYTLPDLPSTVKE